METEAPNEAVAWLRRWVEVYDAECARGDERISVEVKALRGILKAHDTNDNLLRSLLAVIHRDGGHYVENHGLEKAVEDAVAIVLKGRA